MNIYISSLLNGFQIFFFFLKVNVHTYKYWTLVRETSVVSQHFSSMLIFIGIFIHLYNKNITENTLIFSSTTLLVILFLIWSSKMKDIDPRFIVNSMLYIYIYAI